MPRVQKREEIRLYTRWYVREMAGLDAREMEGSYREIKVINASQNETEGNLLKWSEFKHLRAFRADIESRKRMISKLQEQIDRGPVDVSDTVQSSSDAGSATIICHATIHGQDIGYIQKKNRLEKAIEDLSEKNIRYSNALEKASAEIESERDPLLRSAMRMFCLDGAGYEEIAEKLGGSGDAWRKQIHRFFDEKIDRT
jgi:hypothetical protein